MWLSKVVTVSHPVVYPVLYNCMRISVILYNKITTMLLVPEVNFLLQLFGNSYQAKLIAVYNQTE
jgi:hypothetical protein